MLQTRLAEFPLPGFCGAWPVGGIPQRAMQSANAEAEHGNEPAAPSLARMMGPVVLRGAGG